MLIRDATSADWETIWPFFQHIVSAGDTYCYDRHIIESQARSVWLLEPPGRTVVATDAYAVLGSAKMHPNQGGPGGHIATASFMVDPRHAGRGWDGLWAAMSWTGRAPSASEPSSSTPWSRRTPAQSHYGVRWDSRCWPPCPRPSTTRRMAMSGCRSCIGASEPGIRIRQGRCCLLAWLRQRMATVAGWPQIH